MMHLENAIYELDVLGPFWINKCLRNIQNFIQGQPSWIDLTVKWDGSPSVYCGRRDNRFFVATHGFHNKIPKLYHSFTDIEQAYPNLPELQHKLKTCLIYLPNVSMRGDVWQGEFLFSAKDLKTIKANNKFYRMFTPNTLSYVLPEQFEKFAHKFQLGIVFHTQIDPWPERMNMEYWGKPNPEVFAFDARYIPNDFQFYVQDFQQLIQLVEKVDKNITHHNYEVLSLFKEKKILDKLELFCNQIVREGGNFSYSPGVYNTLMDKFGKWTYEPKTEKGRANRRKVMDIFTAERSKVVELYDFYADVIAAKHKILEMLLRDYRKFAVFYEQSPNNFVQTTHEGLVLEDLLIPGRCAKLVNRYNFSFWNFKKHDSVKET